MSSGPFDIYAPPGVYTTTQVEQDASGPPVGTRIPVIIGEGQESLQRTDYEVVRGSSASADQRIVNASVAGRYVVDNSNPDSPLLGDSTGTQALFQLRNFPVVSGNGQGAVTSDPQDISVTVDGELVSPAALNGALGIVTLQLPPASTADVRVTYFFNRTDTQVTDTLSAQVADESAELSGGIVAPYDVISGQNDQLLIAVDGAEAQSVILTAGTGRTAQQIALDVNSATITGLTATTDEDNQGNFRLLLQAEGSIVLGSGSANSLLGFANGQSTSRSRVFYTYQTPLVTGDNGGVVTTNPNDVSVSVDGQPVAVSSVDGSTGAVTLAQAPPVGAEVKITYFFNTFQDTFDYLPDTSITRVARVGISPGRRDYVQGVDYVLDASGRILWGASATVASGVHTAGTEFFDATQVTTTLVDNRVYLESAQRFVDRTLVPVQTSDYDVVLSRVPTLGNGRSTSLDTSLFSELSNDRTGVATARPDLVKVYHGVTIAQAIAAGEREVSRVNPTTRRVTLDEPIPPDHKVWATYYYSRLQDDTITLRVATQSTPSTPGQYTLISSTLGAPLYNVKFGSKTSTSFTATFPSGSEQNPDAFIPGTSGVNEVVTVTFTDNEAQSASLTNSLPGTYDIYAGSSDTLHVNVSGNDFAVDLSQSAFGVLVSDALGDGVTFNIVTGDNDVLSLNVDGVVTDVTFPNNPAATLSEIQDAINLAIPTTARIESGEETFNLVLGTSDALALTLNGTAVPVTLTAGAAVSAAAVVAEIGAAITGAGLTLGDVNVSGNDANVTDVGGVVVIEASVSIETGTGNANAELGFLDSTTYTNISVARARDGGGDSDRLLLRSQVSPANPGDISSIQVLDGSANSTLGFADFVKAEGTESAVNKPATLLSSEISATDLIQIAATPSATFIATVDGVEDTVTGFGGVTTLADLAAILDGISGVTCTVEDSKLRLTSSITTNNSSIVIGAGTANSNVGFSLGDAASQRRVEASEIVAVLNATASDWDSPVTLNDFIATAYAEVFNVQGEGDYIRMQTFSVGAATSLTILSGTDSAVNDTGLGFEVAQSASGIAQYDGFQVTSSNASGSNGTGVVGQTYVDGTTGLTFTLLDEAGGNYPVGESFTFTVSSILETSISSVVKAVGGVEMVVSDTLNVGVGDTATLTTFNATGEEPSIGDFYYVTYSYTKTDFTTILTSRFSTVQANFGALSSENPLTLAAFLAFQNGASVVGLKQVQRASGSGQASNQAYIEALDELAKPLLGGTRPDLLVPLTSDPDVQGAYDQHAQRQSSLRFRQERRCIFGVASGTRPEDVREIARGLNSARAILLYPDSAIMTLEDSEGGETSFIVDGTYLAAAMAGVLVNPQFDVAQPLTRRTLVGFARLNRTLDEPTKNALATDGVTVLEDAGTSLRVRDGLTTQPGSVFTSIPSIVAIQDFVQQRSRATLDRFIGSKFLVSRSQDVEVAMTGLLNGLVEGQIIVAFRNVTASPDASDPTTLRVTAFYAPVFPLKYIPITFTIGAQGLA